MRIALLTRLTIICLLFTAGSSSAESTNERRCEYKRDDRGILQFVCSDDDRYPRYHEPKKELEHKRYPCTVDCSGHEAGYNWAIKKGITDPQQCGGKSLSFVEGCRAAAQGR